MNGFLAAAVRTNKWAYGLSAAGILAAIAFVYLPVSHAQFVWDDIADFKEMAWLRHGNDWQHLLLHKFNDWIAYFRPLGVALFTVEVRVFDANPGPMHLVSLLIHLINTLLVGLLARRVSVWRVPPDKRIYAFALPMLLYGMHPVLIEPVVWIGCQFDLVATLFMLLGWWLGIGIKHRALRAGSTGICFFLAACAKESAIAFLPVLIVFHWYALEVPYRESTWKQLRKLLVQNGATYAAILIMGVVYLALRRWSLGQLVPEIGGEVLPIGGRLQEASFLYLRYWRMFWPSVDMGPLHPVDIDQFLAFSAWALLRDAVAIGAIIASIVLTIRRSYAGGLILCVTFALFPVLHIIAANFDRSLFHERYAMTALALACVWLPLVLAQIPVKGGVRRILSIAILAGLVVWTTLAVMTIRVTVPLWSTQVKLWQWALQENPGFIDAENQLISGYIMEGSYTAAWQLIDRLVADNASCTDCMLNAATLSLRENNPKRADFFLQRIKNSPELYGSVTSYRTYLSDVGTLKLMEGDAAAAEQLERLAVTLDKSDPAPQLVLAEALAFQEKWDEAKQVESVAISLLEPSDRPAQRQRFAYLLKYLRDHQEAKASTH